MTASGRLVRVGGDGCGPVRQAVAHRPAAALRRRAEERNGMDLRGMKRIVTVGVLTGALLFGVWGGTGGAASRTPATYSDDDCATLLDVQVEDSSGGGYWGETARNASDAFKGAAADIESKKLKKSMKTLARVWRIVGEKRSPIAAAKATARIGNRYTNALGTYTEALVTCSNQSVTTTTEDTSSTDDTSAIDDTSSTDDTTSSSDSSE
jgi:hypothetical protein